MVWPAVVVLGSVRRGGEEMKTRKERTREKEEEEEGGEEKEALPIQNIHKVLDLFCKCQFELFKPSKHNQENQAPLRSVPQCLETGLSLGLMMSPAALCVEFPYPPPPQPPPK